MSTTCPKCGYVRKATDAQPDWQCPGCGIAYVKAGEPPAKLPLEINAAGDEPRPGPLLMLVLLVAIAGGAYAWYRQGPSAHPPAGSNPVAQAQAQAQAQARHSPAPEGSVEVTAAEMASQFPGVASQMSGPASPAVEVHWYKTELPGGRFQITTRRLLSSDARRELSAIADARVVLFGTADCPYCAQVRGFLRSQNIAYADLDIENNARARSYEIETLKTSAYPVIVVYNEVHYGWNKSALAESVRRY